MEIGNYYCMQPDEKYDINLRNDFSDKDMLDFHPIQDKGPCYKYAVIALQVNEKNQRCLYLCSFQISWYIPNRQRDWANSKDICKKTFFNGCAKRILEYNPPFFIVTMISNVLTYIATNT